MVSHDGQCRVGSVMSVMMMLAGMVEVSIKIADFHAARSSCMPDAKKVHTVANLYAHVSPTSTVGESAWTIRYTVPHRYTQACFM